MTREMYFRIRIIFLKKFGLHILKYRGEREGGNQCPHDGNKELTIAPGLYIHKSKPSHHPTRSKICRGLYMLFYIIYTPNLCTCRLKER